MYIYYIEMFVCVCIYIYIYTLYKQYMYTLQVHVSTSGIVIHYIGGGSQFPNPQEILCFVWEFCVRIA